jgi:alpha-tubulin suppressor-like RCC1 family protein
MIKSTRLPGLILLSICWLAVIGMTNNTWAAVPKIAAGGDHTVALRADGTLWAWGDNTFGQLGDGTTTSRNAPTRVGTDTDWSDVSAGFYHTLAVRTDGTLWAWGDNTKGQLGDGAASFSRSVPVKIGTDANWAAIAAGDFHSLALKADHSLWAWGDNTGGQVGNGSVVPGIQPVPARIGADIDWNAIAAGGVHSVALKTNHTLWAWGSNAAGQLGNGTNIDAVAPVQIVLPAPFINTDWNVVAAGRVHTVALKTNGTLWAWGSNIFGQLGDGTTQNSKLPVQEASGATVWVAVSAGDAHSLGRQSDGTLWTWGGNDSGQLGNGSNVDAHAPVKVGLDTDWADAAAGSVHTVARKANGTVWSWGGNTFGQLGDGTNSPKSSPVQVPLNILFPPVTITAAAAPNGTISPSGAVAVSQGSNQTFSITPAAGFKVSALVVDGTLLPGATTHTFTGVTADHYINAYFEPSTLTITAAAAANGSISPAGAIPVTPGSDQTYTITPNAGFMVTALVVDGTLLPGVTTYTFTNVTASHYINAYFDPIPATVTITAAAGTNGAISPAGAATVAGGTNQTYTITPNTGFMVAALVVDGTQLPGATTYTFTNVIADHYINAYFEPSNITVTAAAAANGSISPAGVSAVTPGSNLTYTITADPGFSVSALVVDGQLLPGATTHTFTNITTSHYINAYFQ